MKYLVKRPRLTLLLLLGICLITFWLSIPLPRIDNQLVGSDGTYYYMYLPSFWLDGDLDFADEYAYFLPEVVLSGDGLPPNKYAIGAPLLWSPFFLVGHGVIKLLNVLAIADIPAHGYGYVYQAFTLTGSIVLGILALWFTYQFTLRSTTQPTALIATIVVALGGNLIYYIVAEPSMAHTASAFCSSVFFLYWSRRRDHWDLKTAVGYGLLAGLMALVRPQDGILLVLPFISQLPVAWKSLRSPERTWLLWIRNGLIAGITALTVFSLQVIVWHHVYDGFLYSGYTEEAFSWFAPKIGAVLFSARHGLFTWHPVYLLAVLGVVLIYKRDKTLACTGLLGFAIQAYIIASWHSWFQGDAFGGRMFIVCVPLFSLGFAHLLEHIEVKLATSWVYGLSAFLLVWNFLLFIQYRFDRIYQTTPANWFDITAGRLVFIIDKLRQLLFR